MLPPFLRQALRSLARAPGFALAVVATLALGIGVNAAVFSVAWSTLLAPLPLAEPERLVAIYETLGSNARRAVAPANFLDWRREAKNLVGAASYFQQSQVLEGFGEPRRIDVAKVSSQFFDLLGVAAERGRLFRGGEQTALAVVSAPFWERELGGGPIEGRTLRLDGRSYEIVGLAPAQLDLPASTVVWTLAPRDVAGLPVAIELDPTTLRDAHYLGVYARLAPGTTLASANAELATLAQRLERAFPAENRGAGARAYPLARDLGERVEAPLKLLSAGASVILLIACSNVAGLLLARSLARRRDIAVRAALGAGSDRLVLPTAVETSLLALAGLAAGLLLATWVAPLLVARLPGATVAGRGLGTTLAVALFGAGVAAFAAFAAAIAPALATVRVAPAELLAGGLGTTGVRRERLRSTLVVVQAALALVLVASTLLMARSLARVSSIAVGFDAEGVSTVRLWLPTGPEIAPERRARTLGEAVATAATAPGVMRAGAALKLPLTGGGISAGLTVDGRAVPEGQEPDVSWRVVAGDYFETLGIPLVAGRRFVPADDGASELVALINQTLARQIFPGEDPLGRRIRTGLDLEDGFVTVVGVVGDTPHTALTAPTLPEMYRPLGQHNRFGSETMALAVRTAPGFSVPALRERLRAVAPEMVLEPQVPLADIVRRTTARERLLGGLLALFGGLALLLAGLGLYGVLALVVSERQREMGIRLAVGASAGDLRRMVLRRAAAQALLGLALGLPATLAATRLLRSWLWQISPADPWSLLGAALVLALVTLLAASLPARRAAKLSPSAVLREG